MMSINNCRKRKAGVSLRMSLRAMLMATIMLLFAGNAGALRPTHIPDPSLGNGKNFIADPYDQLSPETEAYVNKELYKLKQKTTCEVAVAVVEDLDGMTREEFAYELFKHWGIGKKDKNNGVLLLIATKDRQGYIQVGSGAEGAMPDIACANIMRNYVVPAMKADNLNQAVSGAVNAIGDLLENPDVADELRSNSPDSMANKMKAIDKEVIFDFIKIVALFVFLFTLCMLFVDLAMTRKRSNYRRAMVWKSHMSTYWWGAALSLGTALPIALFAYWRYRHARDVTEICDTCGAKMKKLSEDEDNAFLTASQDFEEKLGTVDYDVWLCPECGTVARFPYVERQLKYSECPECHTIAMNLVMDKVVEPATTRRAGHGERVYRCQYCKHEKRVGYSIPKKDDSAAALAAGVAAGSILGRGGGGGSFGGGGGFGGGSTSGGGAGAGW